MLFLAVAALDDGAPVGGLVVQVHAELAIHVAGDFAHGVDAGEVGGGEHDDAFALVAGVFQFLLELGL